MPEQLAPAKLGIRPRVCVLLLDVPEDVREQLEPLPDGAVLASTPPGDVVLAACTRRADVERHAPVLIEAAQLGAIGGRLAKRPRARDRPDPRRGLDVLIEPDCAGSRRSPSTARGRACASRPDQDVRAP